ncbi:hypothetical protein ABZP36_021695 [Zizania latifolia]
MTAPPDRDRGPIGTAAAMRRPGPWCGPVSPSGGRVGALAFPGASHPRQLCDGTHRHGGSVRSSRRGVGGSGGGGWSGDRGAGRWRGFR